MTEKLSVVIPCFNEERTLTACVEKVLALRSTDLDLEIVIVDDCSKDRSLAIAHELGSLYKEVRVVKHERNLGKGAALRTGFRAVSGNFVAVQDADLEYDPQDLKKLIHPLRDGRADVVIGSRFKGEGPHRVLYYWHSIGNAFLTLLSNMFTDLNLTDMESCYKAFTREVIQSIDIAEDRFGFEPEIIAKVAHRNLRIYEVAISYTGRTYDEGKKITWKDGFRALYCIFRYNSGQFPLPIQFVIYLVIGGFCAAVNLASFLALLKFGFSLVVSTALSFMAAAILNYFLCIAVLFRHKQRWSSTVEIFMYVSLVTAIGIQDVGTTKALMVLGMAPWLAKSLTSGLGLVLNFLGRRFVVFAKPPKQEAASSSAGEVVVRDVIR